MLIYFDVFVKNFFVVLFFIVGRWEHLSLAGVIARGEIAGDRPPPYGYQGRLPSP